jgi:hypothetical protein
MHVVAFYVCPSLVREPNDNNFLVSQNLYHLLHCIVSNSNCAVVSLTMILWSFLMSARAFCLVFLGGSSWLTVVRHLCHLAIFEEFHISSQNAGTHAGISVNIIKPVSVCSRIVLYDEFGHSSLAKQYIICRWWTFITDLLKMYATAGPITPMILITFSIALICCDIYIRC